MMTFSLHRHSVRAALAVCAALLSACTPSVRGGAADGPSPGPREARVWTPESPAREISRWMLRECGRPAAAKPACVERGLVALIGQTGIGRTMEVLDTLVAADADVRFNAHGLAHGLGIAAFRSPQTMAATFAACTPTQMSGCYHGVVQGYFLSLARQGRLPGTPELDAMCQPHRGSPFLFFQCAHGMGHGLMAVHDNHVPMSLQACDLASDEHTRQSCYGGVFMENIVRVSHPHHTAEGHAGTQGHEGHGGSTEDDAHAGHAAGQHASADAHAGHGGMEHGEWTPLDRNDPHYPCNAVAAKYQEQCYNLQTSAILFFNSGDVAATGRVCEQAPERMVSICFGSLGRDITALAAQNHGRSLEMCARTAGQAAGKGELWCMIGVVQNLVNLAADPDEGMRFCRAVTGAESKRHCYRVVGEMIGTLLAAPERRDESCQAAESEYVPVCRTAAGAPASSGSDDE